MIQVQPEKLLVLTYWSPLSGVPDVPENYQEVRYKLAPENGSTRLTITQDKNASPEEKAHSEKNWQMVLDSLKKLLEK